MPNRLSESSSPYLLQHAQNPVHWQPWDEKALAQARQRNKPILVSIGYSACHWCHVMESQSFENELIAEVMNEHFVCIKVDREERPDVDAIYMDAVQAMGVHGGWPLNVFLLPDQRPFFGGTYFPPEKWLNLLNKIGDAFKQQELLPQLEASAERLTNYLNVSASERYKLTQSGHLAYNQGKAKEMFEALAQQFDRLEGGVGKAPKFPMPSVYLFLLRYHHAQNDESALRQLHLTLQRMARGGIYDQIGGGFARYSVTSDWLVPHFEKMLYDNAQLLSLYSEAYLATGQEEYRRVIEQTVAFLEHELRDENGGFYAALDADSEGEEGKFYLWSQAELRDVLGEEADLCAAYFDVTPQGNWEEAKSTILQRKTDDQTFSQEHKIAQEELQQRVLQWQQKLLAYRENRVRPARDEKILTAWNGLLLKGLADAHLALNDVASLRLADELAAFLETTMLENGRLWRNYKDGKVTLLGYLEDYAAAIQGFLALYQLTFKEKWLNIAQHLSDYVLKNFNDPDESLLFFTDQNAEALLVRKKEVFDNVIPASNSIMAQNLFALSHILDREDYREKALSMLASLSEHLSKDTRFLSNWATLYLHLAQPLAEVCVVGKEAIELAKTLQREHYFPAKVMLGTSQTSELPLLKEKTALEGKTAFYVCRNRTCRLPVTDITKAIAEL